MPRPSLGATMRNFLSYPAPTATKLRMLAANNAIKLRRRSRCCGNHGQPGC